MTGSDVFSGLAILIAAIVAGYVMLKNSSQENAKKAATLKLEVATGEADLEKKGRNGIIAEYEKVVKDHNERFDALVKEVGELRASHKSEVGELRKQIAELYEVIHKMQDVGVIKDAHIAEQAKKAERQQEIILEAKDEVTVAAVAAAKSEAERVAAVAAQVAATVVAPAVPTGNDVVVAIRDILSENVIDVKEDVGIIKADVKDVKKTLEDK